MKQDVFWGIDQKTEKKVLIVLQDHGDCVMHIYKIDPKLLSKEEIDRLFQGIERVQFPEPHEHVVHDLLLSPIIPVYARVRRTDIVDKIGKDAHRKALNIKESEILLREMELLYEKVNSSYKYEQQLEIQAKHFSSLVAEKKRESKIIPRDAYVLQKKIDTIFEKLDKKFKEACEENLTRIKSKVDRVKRLSGESRDWNQTRKEISDVREELKGVSPLTKDQKDKLWESVRQSFETLNKRQDEEHKQHETECRNNYYEIQGKVSHCLSLAGNSKEWGNAREEFKKVQEEVRGKKLNKDQRAELIKKIQESFDTLSRRQTESSREYEKECNENYRYLMSLAENCWQLAQSTTDWRLGRERLKQAQNEMQGKKLFKDQRETLRRTLNKAFDVLNSRASSAFEEQRKERERKHFEWQARLRESVDRLKESAARLESSIFNDKSHINDLYNKKMMVRPGNREYEIKSSIQEKINSIEHRVSEKQGKLHEMWSKLEDMRRKLE